MRFFRNLLKKKDVPDKSELLIHQAKELLSKYSSALQYLQDAESFPGKEVIIDNKGRDSRLSPENKGKCIGFGVIIENKVRKDGSIEVIIKRFVAADSLTEEPNIIILDGSIIF